MSFNIKIVTYSNWIVRYMLLNYKQKLYLQILVFQFLMIILPFYKQNFIWIWIDKHPWDFTWTNTRYSNSTLLSKYCIYVLYYAKNWWQGYRIQVLNNLWNWYGRTIETIFIMIHGAGKKGFLPLLRTNRPTIESIKDVGWLDYMVSLFMHIWL